MPNIESRITAFRADIDKLTPLRVVRKHIIHGDCYVLTGDQYFELKSEVAEHFNIHTNEVLVVGSAKLGFSIAGYKRYEHFGDDSDIDVALVSQSLFDEFWQAAYDFWRDRRHWETESDFRKYLFRGWIRPDMLPVSHRFPRRSDWWEFFRSLTNSNRYGEYKITGALYKSWYYLEHYQEQSVIGCK